MRNCCEAVVNGYESCNKCYEMESISLNSKLYERLLKGELLSNEEIEELKREVEGVKNSMGGE